MRTLIKGGDFSGFIADKQFLMICSGESYSTRFVLGKNLVKEWEIACFGEVGNAPDDQLKEAAERISDPDYWIDSVDFGPAHYDEEVGETDRLQFYLITEPMS